MQVEGQARQYFHATRAPSKISWPFLFLVCAAWSTYVSLIFRAVRWWDRPRWIGLLIGAFLFLASLAGFVRREGKLSGGATMLLLAMLAGSVGSALMSHAQYLAWPKLLSFVAMISTALFVLQRRPTAEEHTKLLRCYVYVLLPVVVGSLIAGAVGVTGAWMGGRLRGLTPNPNSLGQVVLVVIPGAMYALANRATPARIGAFLVVMAALLLCRSRACLGAFLLSLLVWYAVDQPRQRAFRLLAVNGLLFAVLMLTPELFEEESKNFLYRGGDTILMQRAEAWAKTIENFKEEPWLGFGFGVDKSTPRLRRFRLFFTSIMKTREFGNGYLGSLESIGLIGTVPLYLLIIASLVRYSRMLVGRAQPPETRRLLKAYFVLLIVCLVNAVAEAWFFAAGNPICLAFWIALLAPFVRPIAKYTPSPVPVAGQRFTSLAGHV